MELAVRNQKDDEIDIEFKEERKTVLHLLKERLLEDDTVVTATVLSDHPQLGHPRLVVRTSGAKPETAIKKAAQSLRKDLDGLEDAFLAAL